MKNKTTTIVILLILMLMLPVVSGMNINNQKITTPTQDITYMSKQDYNIFKNQLEELKEEYPEHARYLQEAFDYAITENNDGNAVLNENDLEIKLIEVYEQSLLWDKFWYFKQATITCGTTYDEPKGGTFYKDDPRLGYNYAFGSDNYGLHCRQYIGIKYYDIRCKHVSCNDYGGGIQTPTYIDLVATKGVLAHGHENGSGKIKSQILGLFGSNLFEILFQKFLL